MRTFVYLLILLSLAFFSFAPQVDSATTYPAAFDWRDVGGNNFITPPKNVGSCGSTWLFGPVAAVESKIMILNDDPTIQPDLSEMHVFACGVNQDPCSGGFPGDAFDFMKATGSGITTESCYPYDAAGSVDCLIPCASPSHSYIDTYTFINNASQMPEAVKQMIYDEGPMVTHFDVYDDFSSYSSGVYQKTSDSYRGGKTVLLVGWGNNGSTDYWIAKNDWGTIWGEGGYFKVAMGDPSITLQYIYYTHDVDYDGDGHFTATDCDDTNDAVHPGATELDDDVDNNCDGQVDEGFGSTGGGGGGGCNTAGLKAGETLWADILVIALLVGMLLAMRWRRTRVTRQSRFL